MPAPTTARWIAPRIEEAWGQNNEVEKEKERMESWKQKKTAGPMKQSHDWKSRKLNLTVQFTCQFRLCFAISLDFHTSRHQLMPGLSGRLWKHRRGKPYDEKNS